MLIGRPPNLVPNLMLTASCTSATRPGTARVLLFARECGTSATKKKNSLILLGLKETATASEIKKAYYRLAKETHPDVIARQAREAAAKEAANVGAKVVSFGKSSDGILNEDHEAAMAKPTVVPFLEVQAAYDFLMNDGDDDEEAAKKARTKKAGARPSRERTLGEVLCDRLRDEPESLAELWEDIMRDEMRVTEPMFDALFKAAKRTAKRGALVDAARTAQRLVHEGSAYGLLTIDVRCSAFVSLLSWCQEEEEELGDVAMEIIDQINDDDRAHSPAVMAAIGSVFCSGTRSPY